MSKGTSWKKYKHGLAPPYLKYCDNDNYQLHPSEFVSAFSPCTFEVTLSVSTKNCHLDSIVFYFLSYKNVRRKQQTPYIATPCFH